ncbi:diaminobutyrate acetyltransferase [Coraliomargarita sp. SDUM461004]|uniref:L-2,4-diaminobutyric acid acetyltransferase n=1 Tax=Thalassobacterium sedimentorum TaxID=3041258 RepID=A0ABU1AIB1_9BACT|nr:diaminobutyrate acetyltransferase [Coraliomargarita sp. SDUM461004]MDQ8193521.1 diaminobutyrate acetyltransferase [Coraliomargarita sp. SDUM461004]
MDGLSINRLVADSPPLDTNSTYCNLLQCIHFSDTSIIAKQCGETVGFVSGYMIPRKACTLFIWQVVVGASARGQGLAMRMLRELLCRGQREEVRFIETTITIDNEASWALFRKLAKELSAKLEVSVAFDKDTHFFGEHETEHLVRIGPFN